MKKIYLASPYTHEDPAIVEQRYFAARDAAGVWLRAGYILISPIAHYHPIACAIDLPKDFPFWERLDYSLIDWADEVWVLMLPGFADSKGIQAETHYAKSKGKRVHYLAMPPL